MTVFTEGRATAEFMISEARGFRSRDAITVVSGQGKLAAGTVLSKQAVGAATAAAKSGGNTGNGTISAVTVLTGAKAGVYIVFKGQDTALNAQAVTALIALAGGIIGSYCFAAVWDDNSKRDAAVAAEAADDRPDPPTSLPTDRE